MFGLAVALLTVTQDTFLFPYLDLSWNESIRDFFQTLPFPLFLLIIAVFIGKSLASSQIFILSASNFLRQPKLLIPYSRFIRALIYTAIETVSAVLVVLTSYLLFAPLFFLNPENTRFSLLANASLSIFLISTLLITVIKHLTLGYILLSPLRFRSSLNLAAGLFVRYRYFSALSFFSALLIMLLFTILGNLVILQYAFIGRYLPEVASETFVFTVLLFAGTFISVFLEVFWLNFFFILTNKNQKKEKVLPLTQKDLEGIPSTPFL